MSSESYHEPIELLSEHTKNTHRAIVSLKEELEAIDWYQQRAEACTDSELSAVLIHNKNEEVEHAMMTLEWLRRANPVFASNIDTYLKSSGPITEVEEQLKGGSVGGAASGSSPSLGIGSLRPQKMMDLLKRKKAPIVDEAWEQIDEEARRVLKLHLAGRKLVDFSGPHGWAFAAVNTGRLKHIEHGPVEHVAHAIRDVRPLVELRSPILLPILELDYAARGAADLDLDPVILAAESMARAEDDAIFHGFSEGKITGIIEASPHQPIEVRSSEAWPSAVSAAKDVLRMAGVNGPYALALGVEAYDEITAEGEDGYPLRNRIEERVAEGSLVWAPAVKDGAVLLSVRGGDYELTVGQDLSLGYASHDRTTVELYLTESFTFRVLEDKAAIFLRRVR